MAESIKEKIIQRVVTRAAKIAGGAYNTTLANVYRMKGRALNENLPAAFVIARKQELSEQDYFGNTYELPITIQLISEYGSTNPDEIASQMEADLIECFLGRGWMLLYDTGTGTAPGVTNASLLGERGIMAGNTYTIQDVVGGGSWDDGDANGYIIAIRPDSESIIAGLHLFGAAGLPSVARADVTAAAERKMITEIFGTDVEIMQMAYAGSGVDEIPDVDDTVVSVVLDIEITYKTKPGNPYEQG